jgi:hypothetical protein
MACFSSVNCSTNSTVDPHMSAMRYEISCSHGEKSSFPVFDYLLNRIA